MANCKPISTPLDQNGKLSAHASDVLENVTTYMKIVGSLVYMTITLDTAFDPSLSLSLTPASVNSSARQGLNAFIP